jgi:hypothetical protein
MNACVNWFVAPQVDPQSIIMWGLRVRMAIATGAVESIKVWAVSSHTISGPRFRFWASTAQFA